MMRKKTIAGKINITALGLAAVMLLSLSCSKKGEVTFCEGIDSDGKGVSCGKVFSTGDLTAVFEAKDRFGTDSLTMKVFNADDGDRKPEQTRAVTVSPDESNGHSEMELYDEGRFNVVIEKHGDIVAEGKIEIIDSIPNK